MSCEIQLTATLEGVSKFLQQTTSNGGENEEAASKNPFSDYKIALSPTGEILAFAKSSWLLICSLKWDPGTVDVAKIKYSPSWHGHLQCKPGEKITSLLCLPFFSYGQTVHVADWTCMVVGFSSGCIRFYTEQMQELASNSLHQEPIIEIKSDFSSLLHSEKTLKQDNNDIYVLYKTAICIFNGPNLSQLLISRRNQLAKRINFESGKIDSFTLFDFKKYFFVKQENITDACFLGQTLASTYNTFDHLVATSYSGGFHSNYRPSPPQSSLIITSGKKPFVGFHYTLETGSSLMLAEVALAVANKIKSNLTANLSGWFGFGNKKSSGSDESAISPSNSSSDYKEQINCRFGLCDAWREGQSIILSPDGAFSAVTDSLGRVTLIDNAAGVARRLWKGFRDAQCGFLLVKEDVRKTRRAKGGEAKSPPRQGLFIVIYGPKKGLIEIFSTQNGGKVTGFKVTKHGRLIYNPRGYMAPNVSVGGFNLGRNQVVFISEDGLREFLVPFHCALPEDNSKMSRDLHILKKMKLLLKTEWNSPNLVEEMEKYAKELTTDEVRHQAVEMLMSNRNTSSDAFKAVLDTFLKDFRDSDRSEPPPKKVVALAEVAYNLISFHEFLDGINDLSSCDSEDFRSSPNASSLFEPLRMPERELEILLEYIDRIKEIEGFRKLKISKVAFDERKSVQMENYLSSFDFDSFLNGFGEIQQEEKEKIPANRSNRLRLKKNGNEESFISLGERFFRGILNRISGLNEWCQKAENCRLEPIDLAVCLLSYWCHGRVVEEDFSVGHVINMVEILKAICSLNDPNVVSIECNTESPWWSQLRSYISSSPSTVCGLFAALCCRSVTIFVEQKRELTRKKKGKKHKSNEGHPLHVEWETVSKDTCQWDILITQLQDVALLNAVVNLSSKETGKMQVLPRISFDFEYQCLGLIQVNGTGRVAELVAKWLAQFGFDPSVFASKTEVEGFRGGGDGCGEETDKSCLVKELDKANSARKEEGNPTLPLDYLALLKTRFPYSLTTNSLLSNLCWEYAAYWYKNSKDLTYLEAGVRCLEMIPSWKIKRGISFLCWSTYLQQKFEALAKMINKLGRVPTYKLCLQEVGFGTEQVTAFLKLTMEHLKLMASPEEEEDGEEKESEIRDFEISREAIWQSGTTAPVSSLISIALNQPSVSSETVMLLLELSTSLLLMSGLNVSFSKIFAKLFDNLDPANFALTRIAETNSDRRNRDLSDSRKKFLEKAIAASVQTVQVVECTRLPQTPSCRFETENEIVPAKKFKVDEYNEWIRICLDLARVWEIDLDDLKRFQICELLSCGFDPLAKEMLGLVDNDKILASQLLVCIGKRLKYLIQDSKNLCDHMANLSSNLSEWLNCLDLDNSKHQSDSIDEIEFFSRHVVKYLSEGHPDQKLAMAIIDYLPFLKANRS